MLGNAPATLALKETDETTEGLTMETRKRLPNKFAIRATGCSHAPAGALEELNEGQTLVLLPMPDNPVDPNALAVMNEALTVQYGWVPASEGLNVRVGLEYDQFSVTVHAVNRHRGVPKGMMMAFRRIAA